MSVIVLDVTFFPRSRLSFDSSSFSSLVCTHTHTHTHTLTHLPPPTRNVLLPGLLFTVSPHCVVTGRNTNRIGRRTGLAMHEDAHRVTRRHDIQH